MPCYHPVTAYQGADGEVKFVERQGVDFVRTLQLACGQCVGCRLERSRQWAVRCMHEAQQHEFNCFITLTYRAAVHSLHYPDFQNFMKIFREALRLLYGVRIRFYMAGEYGEMYGRPHFHACIFGYDFPDKKFHMTTPTGFKLYRSEFLESLWPFGFSSVGGVTFESAAYVARYIMKKLTGDGEKSYYNIFDPDTGEIFERRKEFNRMSLGTRGEGGIGAGWLREYQSDVYPRGKVVTRGIECNAPRYYDKKFYDSGDCRYDDMEFGRHIEAIGKFADNSDARLEVKEQVARAKLSQLKRKI